MTRHSEKKIAARAKFRDKLLESSNPVVAFLTKMAMFFKIKMWAFIEWITAALRKMGVRWKKYEWLKQYKNKYDGKRCFIVATGPSLTVEDLSLLKNEITFGCQVIDGFTHQIKGSQRVLKPGMLRSRIHSRR